MWLVLQHAASLQQPVRERMVPCCTLPQVATLYSLDRGFTFATWVGAADTSRICGVAHFCRLMGCVRTGLGEPGTT